MLEIAVIKRTSKHRGHKRYQDGPNALFSCCFGKLRFPVNDAVHLGTSNDDSPQSGSGRVGSSNSLLIDLTIAGVQSVASETSFDRPKPLKHIGGHSGQISLLYSLHRTRLRLYRQK